MSSLVERWRAQMMRPHVVISELREIGTGLAEENERLRAVLEEIAMGDAYGSIWRADARRALGLEE